MVSQEAPQRGQDSRDGEIKVQPGSHRQPFWGGAKGVVEVEVWECLPLELDLAKESEADDVI